MPSASHCKIPWGPTRFGPTRDCMRAQTRRSSQLVTPASGATKDREHHERHENHGDGVNDFFRHAGKSAVSYHLVEVSLHDNP